VKAAPTIARIAQRALLFAAAQLLFEWTVGRQPDIWRAAVMGGVFGVGLTWWLNRRARV
jgi:hypothetical protein